MPVRDGVPGSEQSTPAGPAADTSLMLRCRRRGHRPGKRPARIYVLPGRCRVCSTFTCRTSVPMGRASGEIRELAFVDVPGSGLHVPGNEGRAPNHRQWQLERARRA